MGPGLASNDGLTDSGPLKGYATYTDGTNILCVAGAHISIVEEVWSLTDKNSLDRLVLSFVCDSIL
jgi:hypothetical protein